MGFQAEKGPGMRRRLLSMVMGATAFFSLSLPLRAQETHVVVMVGLGGDAQYREQFHGWALGLIEAARDRFGITEDRIVYLGERPQDAAGIMDGRSTVENLSATLSSLAGTAGPRDRILLVLIGHGTGQGEGAEFNLPGPDLTPGALKVMLDRFTTQIVAVVDATSSSGPFLPALSGPNRVIMTATRTAQERNETQFGGFFVEALRGEGADLNKDGLLSLAEAFQFARDGVERYYASENLLATEHAQLDDNGDGEGAGDLEPGGADGRLAGTFMLGPSKDVSADGMALDTVSDPELRRLYEERADLERRVVELRGLKGQMEESRYEQELESLLLELAVKNREIRAKGGGGS